MLRLFIYLLIALAVIVPLYGGGDWFGEAELPSGAVTDFYEAIQNLPSNSVVLLAFDYDPSTAAAMDVTISLTSLITFEISSICTTVSLVER